MPRALNSSTLASHVLACIAGKTFTVFVAELNGHPEINKTLKLLVKIK